MSKSDYPIHNNDPVPPYSESESSYNISNATGRKSAPRASLQLRLKQERLRRISNLIANTIEPLVLDGLNDGLHHRNILLIPSDGFDDQTKISETNIVTPTMPSNTVLLRLAGDENKSSFWCQPVVMEEFGSVLRDHFTEPHTEQDLYTADVQAQTRDQISPPLLPPRPPQKSWIKRTFGLPGPDHDPTGSTGNWNLGWRIAESGEDRANSLTKDEVATSVKLESVTFRIESPLGLLESRTIRCALVKVEMGI